MREKRGDCQGWTLKAARANTAFLRSVPLSGLTGVGITFTLTLRDCPPTHDDWKRLREAFFVRLRRAGFIRVHWVTEWQRRGVPHLHGVAYFPAHDHPWGQFIISTWVQLASSYGCSARAQHWNYIHDVVGWLKYLAKHAARGAGHYQRSAESVPEGWQKTGRIWGHLGQWDTRDPMRFGLEETGFFAFRRLCRGYRVADSRASGDTFRIRSARRMLQSSDKALCRVRGVSEWIPEHVQVQMMDCLAANGHSVVQVDG